MLTPTTIGPLYRIEECPELMADTCVCDEPGDLVFLSVWGRDTATQEFLARLTLGPEDDGLERFHLVTDDDHSRTVFTGDARKLEKRTTRVYKRTLFGSMLHVWLFDRRCISPDKTNATALALIPRDAPDCPARLWKLIKETCPLPLLDHWHDPVMDILQSYEMLRPLSFSLGPVQGYYIELDVPALTVALGDLIRSGTLDVLPSTADLPLHRQQAA